MFAHQGVISWCYLIFTGYLGMIDITSVKHLTLPRKDDVDSGPLSTGGDFKFGYETIKAFYVWI